jgi:UDP-N-acetylglucosamine 3-dehydrogenase
VEEVTLGTLRAGVIGLSFGKHHTRILSEMDEIDLVGVSDLNSGKSVIADKYGISFFNKYKDLLKMDLDIALAVVPTKQHCEVAMTIMESGVHCFVEKPIAYSIDEAKSMIECSDTNNVKFAVGHIETFNPAVSRLKEVLLDGVLGDIKYISSRRVGPFVERVLDIGIMIDSATHDVGVIRYLLDKDPIDIYSKYWSIKNDKGDYAIMVLDFGDMSAGIEVNWFTPYPVRTLDITGTKGVAHLDFMTQEVELYTKDYEMKLHIEKQEPLKVELDHFVNCIIRNELPLVSGYEGLKILEIVKKAGAR